MPDAPDLSAACAARLAPRLEQRIVPGLERITAVLARLGLPRASVPSVIVVGTNGKGSTAALLASVIAAHGVRVGLYTSPHLVRLEERIRVDGQAISSRDLLTLLDALDAFPELSFFETLTVAALQHFTARQVGLAVFEAGLGGRWDATNALDHRLALLTNVGTDHQDWLGSTRTQIAAEKAAALRCPDAIVGSWDDEVKPVILAAVGTATRLSRTIDWATVFPAKGAAPASLLAGGPVSGANGAQFEGPTSRSGRVAIGFVIGAVRGEARMPLAGAHQLDNAALALAGAAVLAHQQHLPPLRPEAVRRGIEAVRWPGRLQWRLWAGRDLLLDGAHNAEAIGAIVATLDDAGLSGSIHLLFSCLADKPLARMAALLAPRVASVTVTRIQSPRATPLVALAAAFSGCTVAPDAAAALASLPDDGPILVTGSLRLVGEVLSLIGGVDE